MDTAEMQMCYINGGQRNTTTIMIQSKYMRSFMLKILKSFSSS